MDFQVIYEAVKSIHEEREKNNNNAGARWK